MPKSKIDVGMAQLRLTAARRVLRPFAMTKWLRFVVAGAMQLPL